MSPLLFPILFWKAGPQWLWLLHPHGCHGSPAQGPTQTGSRRAAVLPLLLPLGALHCQGATGHQHPAWQAADSSQAQWTVPSGTVPWRLCVVPTLVSQLPGIPVRGLYPPEP